MNKKNENLLNKCKKCGARCCRYVCIEIDKPTSKRDRDNIRWYLMHKDVNVFYDSDGDWFVEFETECENLKTDNSCAVYYDRPDVCRNYPDRDDLCEYESDEPPYEKIFSNPDDFKRYISSKNKKKKRKSGDKKNV